MTVLVTSRCDGARPRFALARYVHPRENEAPWITSCTPCPCSGAVRQKAYAHASAVQMMSGQSESAMHRCGIYGTADVWREMEMLDRIEQAEKKMRAGLMLWCLGSKAYGNASAFWKQSD